MLPQETAFLLAKPSLNKDLPEKIALKNSILSCAKIYPAKWSLFLSLGILKGSLHACICQPCFSNDSCPYCMNFGSFSVQALNPEVFSYDSSHVFFGCPLISYTHTCTISIHASHPVHPVFLVHSFHTPKAPQSTSSQHIVNALESHFTS